MCLRISLNLHDMVYQGTTRTYMLFFHQNATGRILNRFSKDIGTIDSTLPIIVVDCIEVSVFNSERQILTFFVTLLVFPRTGGNSNNSSDHKLLADRSYFCDVWIVLYFTARFSDHRAKCKTN